MNAPKQDIQPSAPLSAVILASATVVQSVLAGTSLTEALMQVEPGIRPAVQAVSFHAMRRLGWAKTVKQALIPRKPSNALLDALLLVSFSLLAPEAESASVRYAPHTVVDQAVRATAAKRALAPFKGLVNGSLRRFLREGETLLERLQDSMELKWNHPSWWVQRLQQDYPQDWQSILEAANQQPGMSLRVNRRRATRESVLVAFAEQGIGAQPFDAFGIALDQARPVHEIPGFAEGWWSVQDRAAQLAAPLLDLRDGMRVLDACAAPGGKTAHMLELADLDMTVLDVDSRRLARVAENLARLKLDGPHVHMLAADAADLSQWWDGAPFDLVLADVPCTASGIVRRHPDIKWLRQEADLAKTAALQRAIVQALWQTVAPGGYLLYVTCSLFPIEGQEQARYLEMSLPDTERLGAPGQILPLAEQAGSVAPHDGFYYALFRKKPVAGKGGKEI